MKSVGLPPCFLPRIHVALPFMKGLLLGNMKDIHILPVKSFFLPILAAAAY